jgi:benzoate membrane transport protein
MTVAFVAVSALPRLARILPPLIAALVAGALAIALLGTFTAPAGTLFAIAAPTLYLPQFSWTAMVELVVPLAITVLVVQNGQGIAVLAASGHRPPINAITAVCGAGSIVTALTGAVSTCLTGPVNAILAASGERTRHYSAAVLVGILVLPFGLLAPFFTRLLLATPPAFIATLAGLAMLRVLQQVHRLVQGPFRPRRAGVLPGHRRRRAHVPHRRGLLGAGARPRRVVAARARPGANKPLTCGRGLLHPPQGWTIRCECA